jgi:hypothetical protein
LGSHGQTIGEGIRQVWEYEPELQTSGGDCRFSPPRFENYFAELAEEIANGGGQRPDPSVIGRLYAKYDSEIAT